MTAYHEHMRTQVVRQATAGTDQTTIIGKVGRAGVLAAASLLPATTSAFDGTNYRIYTLTNLGQAGAGSTSMATLDTSAVALTAKTERAMALSGTPANLAVAAGDILAIVETHAGTGVAHGGALFDSTIDVTD